MLVIVVVISTFLERPSKAKRRATAYSRAQRRIRAVVHIGGDLAPSLGDGKNFADIKTNFFNDLFLGKNFHFHAENF